jgi:uncharacterized tellurite resistance protein B-like protein
VSDAQDFSAVERVVGDDLRFRLKLGIGEDAYRSIRYGKAVQKLWDVGGVAATGAAAAASPIVASTFFGGSGFLGLIGLGTAATPIGWVIAAGAASAGAYYGVLRLVGKYGDKRVHKVPEFINSPIDLLGATLVDMIGTLAVKLGEVDGDFALVERQRIIAYFIEDWGIDRPYAEKAIALIAENEAKIGLRAAAEVLGRFLRENEDCNAAAIRADILAMLAEIIQADGRVDEREELALEKIDAILRAETDPSLRRTTGEIAEGLAAGIGGGASAVVTGVSAVATGVSEVGATVTGRIGAGVKALGQRLRRHRGEDRNGG